MTDVDLLADGLDGKPLPDRLLELAAMASELAVALRAPRLAPADRARILAHARALAESRSRRRRLLGRRPAPALVAAGAGSAAALALALVGLALVRRTHPHPASRVSVLGRAA